MLEGGAKATTVDAIVAVSGAPKGSLYNRFGSVNDLLAEMWMRAVRRSQAAFLDALREPDPVAAAVAGALSIHDFAQSDALDSRLLAALRREDLIGAAISPRLKKELLELNEPLQAALIDLAGRLFGVVSDETRRADRVRGDRYPPRSSQAPPVGRVGFASWFARAARGGCPCSTHRRYTIRHAAEPCSARDRD